MDKRPTKQPPTREELKKSLASLSKRMRLVGAQMDYYGGFDYEMVTHGRELFGAGQVVKGWVEDMDNEVAE